VSVSRQARNWVGRSQSPKLSSEDQEKLKAILSPALQPLMAIVQTGEWISTGQTDRVLANVVEDDQYCFERLACHYISARTDHIGKAKRVFNGRFLKDLELDAMLGGLNEQVMGTTPTIAQVSAAVAECYQWYEEHLPILRPTEEGKQQVASLRAAIDQAVGAGLLASSLPEKTAARG
jgi:hypothetical protein